MSEALRRRLFQHYEYKDPVPYIIRAAFLKRQVSFAKEPYSTDDILQKRPMVWRSLLLVCFSIPSTRIPCYISLPTICNHHIVNHHLKAVPWRYSICSYKSIQKMGSKLKKSSTGFEFLKTTPAPLVSNRTATHCNTLQHTATHCNTLRPPAPLVSFLACVALSKECSLLAQVSRYRTHESRHSYDSFVFINSNVSVP